MSYTRVLISIILLAATVALFGFAAPRNSPSQPERAASEKAKSDPWSTPEVLPTAPLYFDRFETFDSRDGLPSDKTTSVLPAGEDLWVGTDRGLALRRQGVWTSWNRDDGLAHDYVTSIARDPASGDLWISTLGGLSVFSGGVFENFSQLNSGLMNDVVYQVSVQGRTVWAATAAGASQLDLRTGSWQLFDHENSIMHEPWCYSVTHGADRVWIGVWGAGVVELNQNTGLWREYRDPDKEMEIDLLRDDGPLHDVTAFVAWDSGILWQATYFGLSRYDGRRWRTYRKDDTGLPGDFINHVSARGRVAYLGTDEGFGTTDGELATVVRRLPEGGGEFIVHRDGVEIERRLLSTAPGDNYILWTHPQEDQIWLATGRGLSRGFAVAEDE